MTPLISSTLFYIVSLPIYTLLALNSFEYYAVKYKVQENEINTFIQNRRIPFKWLFSKNYLILRIFLFNKNSKTPMEEFKKHTLGSVRYTRIIVIIFCVFFVLPPLINLPKATEVIWILDRLIFSALSIITFVRCFYFGSDLSKIRTEDY